MDETDRRLNFRELALHELEEDKQVVNWIYMVDDLNVKTTLACKDK
jgi:hypothetical protein